MRPTTPIPTSVTPAVVPDHSFSPVIDLRQARGWRGQLGSEAGTVALWTLAAKAAMAGAGVALAKPMLWPLLGGGLLWRWGHHRRRRPLGLPQAVAGPPEPVAPPLPLTVSIPDASHGARAGRFGLDGASLFRAQHAAICTVHHDERGQITAIRCRPRIAVGQPTIDERDAHPVG